MTILSIITVTLNSCTELNKTMGSVKENSTLPGVEYIIIDGGSTDDTSLVVEKYREVVDIVVSEPDDGIYDAMNKGLMLASGKYCMFLNSGDVLCHLDEVLMLAGKVHYKNNVLLFGSEFSWPDGMVKAFYPSFSFCTMPTSHQAMLFNTEIARAIMYNTKYMFSADYDLYLQMSNRERQPWVSDIVIVKTAPVGFTETSLTAYLIECFKINHFHFNIWCAGIRLIVELSKVVLRILLRTFFKKRWILQIRRLRGGVYVNDN